MNKEHNYLLYAKTAIVLLFLTMLNIIVASLERIGNRPVIIVFICCVQAYIVLNWFMHLKFENKFLKYVVLSVFVLFFVVIVITFLDYKFR